MQKPPSTLLQSPPKTLGWISLAIFLASPFLANWLVSVWVPVYRCGKFGFDCLAYAIIIACVLWLAGLCTGIVALNRGESRLLAWIACILNGLPVLLIAVLMLALYFYHR